MKTKVTIRAALPSDAPALTALAKRSKADWGYPPAWLTLWQDDLTITPEVLQGTLAFVAQLQDQIVGFWCRSAISSNEVTAGWLFIDPEYKRQGIGKRLWQAMHPAAHQLGITQFIIESDPHAVPFYLSLGAVQIGSKSSHLIANRELPILHLPIPPAPRLTHLQTERLVLRPWREEDIEPWWALSQHPQFLQYLPAAPTLFQVRTFIHAANQHLVLHGYTLWAVELQDSGELIGYIGLNHVQWQSNFTPATEVGWRLGTPHWGHGYATEGARAALHYGFESAQLAEIVAFTVPENRRSQAVMARLGMQRDLNADFAHPNLSAEHPLSQHYLYRLAK